MQRVLNAVAATPLDRVKFSLAFGAAFPLFLAAEGLQRLLDHATAEADAPLRDPRSIFAEARENASIAISYALMARTTLQGFARRPRSERLL